MAERLRSILRPTHWSLLIKSAVFTLAWLSLPFWAFVLAAAYLFFFPWFQTRKFFVPFIALIGTMYAFSTPHIWAALLMFATFYLLLGTKELIFVQRHIAYHIAMLFLLFLVSVQLFSQLNTATISYPSLWGLAVVVLFFLMARILFDFVRQGSQDEGSWAVPVMPLAAVLGFLAWQMLLVISFLPLSFLYQAAAFFLTLSTFLEFAVSYYSHELDKRRVLATASVFACLLLIVLSSAPWNL